ncbi:MAG: hypothetical protein PVH02_18560, partial [Desulfobacteraceae bacterium]
MLRSSYLRHFRVVAIIFLFAALIGSGAQAQDKAKQASETRSPEAKSLVAEELSLEKLKAKRAEVEESTGLSDSVKKSTLTYIDQAIRFQEQLNKINKEANDFEQKIKTAPDRIKEIERELKRLAASPEPTRAIPEIE